MGGLFDYPGLAGGAEPGPGPLQPGGQSAPEYPVLRAAGPSGGPGGHRPLGRGGAVGGGGRRLAAAAGAGPGGVSEEVLRLFGALARAPRFSGLMLRDWASAPGRGDGGAVRRPLTIDTGDGARFCLLPGDGQHPGGVERGLQHELPDAGARPEVGGGVPVRRPAAVGRPPASGRALQRRDLASTRRRPAGRPTACWRSTTTTAPASAPGPWMRRAMRRCGGGYTPLYPSPRWWGCAGPRGRLHRWCAAIQSGLFQHSPFSWQILGPDFVEVERVTDASRFVSRTLKEWVASLTPERREQFVDLLFEVLGASGAQTTAELSEGGLQAAAAGLRRPPGTGRRRPPHAVPGPGPSGRGGAEQHGPAPGRGDIREHGGRY